MFCPSFWCQIFNLFKTNLLNYRPHTKYEEGNVFSLSVHRGSSSRGGHPEGYPPRRQGLEGECPWGYPQVKVWRGSPWGHPQVKVGGALGVPPRSRSGGGHPQGYPQVKVWRGAPLGVLPLVQGPGGPRVPPRSRSEGGALGVPLGQGLEGWHPQGYPQVKVWGAPPEVPLNWGAPLGYPLNLFVTRSPSSQSPSPYLCQRALHLWGGGGPSVNIITNKLKT